MAYDLKSIAAPRLSGRALQLFAAAMENAASGPLLISKLYEDTGVNALRAARVQESPSVAPSLPRLGSMELAREKAVSVDELWDIFEVAPERRGFVFESAADFVKAYLSGKASPAHVAERVIEAIAQSNAGDRPLRAVIASQAEDIRAQAAQSAERYLKKAPLGPLDGVPVAIKDELDLKGYATTGGTRFLAGKHGLAQADSAPVERLRAAGAILIGKANMNEIGIDTSGFNAHFGVTRNPYGLDRLPGGSSSGSAAAVAAGLCPIAIGADGGGSIRIPSALCGVVGLKATWSRVSEHGVLPLCFSVGHVGPIGATVRDTALAYMVIAGPDARDRNTLRQPLPHVDSLGNTDLSGVRIGVYDAWFEDSQAEVVKACRDGIALLVERGAKVISVSLSDLNLCRVAHAITILSEMATFAQAYDHRHRKDYGLAVRVNLALARSFSGSDYVAAQRIRTRLCHQLEELFEKVDVLATPATAMTAPALAGDLLPLGESNLNVTSALMRFAFVGNLSGYPALTVPAGYDGAGLPVGLQLMAKPWEEGFLLQLGEVVEAGVLRKQPARVARLLGIY